MSLALSTQNWLQKTLDYIQNYSFLRYRVRNTQHIKSFSYERILSDNNSTLRNENFYSTYDY